MALRSLTAPSRVRPDHSRCPGHGPVRCSRRLRKGCSGRRGDHQAGVPCGGPGRTSSTRRRSFTHTGPPQSGHTGLGPRGLDMNEYRPARFVDRAEHGHIAKAHEKLADANRVNFHRGSRSWRRMMDDWRPFGRSSLTFCD